MAPRRGGLSGEVGANREILRKIALWLIPSLLVLSALALIGPRNPATERVALQAPTVTPEAVYPGLGAPRPTGSPLPARTPTAPAGAPAAAPTPTVAATAAQVAALVARADAGWDRDWDAAIGALEALGALEPANPVWPEKLYAAYLEQAEQFAREGRYGEARWRLEQAIALDPGRGAAQRRLAELPPG